MTRQWIFALCGSACFLHVRADDLSDFSNNLATDIAPLLVLFGDSMTKQYLSESTSFLDYFIFAMAPIGVLTAIISAIRVCGHSSLRAFIGRSQEGEGTVEAELCTSTSRDVCELFNRGGITRVLGKPDILELVYDPGTHSTKLLRDYLANGGDKAHSWWQKHDGRSLFRKTKPQDGNPVSFAPKPNLSLNVGIVRPPDWVLYVIAAVGFVLQTGVLALAGVGVWILGWNLSGSESSASKNYAPIMFIMGTILMCGGMWSCAALIGQTTREVRFRRTGKARDDAAQLPRLLWLQPGPQVIGDQSFDPFAYLEDTATNPLQTWTSSRKDFDEKLEIYTFFAVSAVLLGYITQFIGLRGMKAWVSLTQLGITLIMSVLRGCLRMQRLGRNDNLLLAMPDMVSGYELEWLSFQIIAKKDSGGNSKGTLSLHFTSQFGDALDISARKEIQARVGAELTANGGLVGGLDYTSLLTIRRQLAHLTGNVIIGETSESQKWTGARVKVRTKAVEICNAICQAAEDLWKKRQWKHQSQGTTTLQVRAITDNRLIDISLCQPSDESRPGWRMDTAQVEAILGLWMWTLISDERVVSRDDSEQKKSLAEDVQCMGIVSAGLDNDNWDRVSDKQAEMDLWLGSNRVTLLYSTLLLTKQSLNGITALWDANNEGAFELISSDSKSTVTKGKTRRFCGWYSLHGRPELTQDLTSRSGQQGSQPARLRVQIIPTQGSLLDLCARELFASLMLSLMGTLNTASTTVLENTGLVRLENPTLASFAQAFTKHGLGSHSEALLCLVPGFRTKSPLPSPEDMLSVLLRAAEAYRKRSEWERAQTLLRWACEQHAPGRGVGAGGSATIPESASSFFTRAFRATGELYRWSLAAEHSNDERKAFGGRGIEWMRDTYGYVTVGQSNTEVSEILNCYEAIAQNLKIAPVSADTHSIPNVPEAQEVAHHFMQALQDENRTDALYYLCLVKTGEFASQALQPALPLAVRNDWNEVVETVLEMKAGLNSQDEHRRTALWYAAQSGRESYVKLLIDLGAFLDQPDNENKTPLFVASQLGHEAVVERLLETGHVNFELNDQDGQTPLSKAAGNGHEAVVKLLIEKGADIESKDRNDQTLLSKAAENGYEAVVKLLIEKGADIESKDISGQTPLSKAAENGHEAVVKLLIEKGADIESKDRNGQTLLSKAAENGHEAVVKLLIEKGADIESKDRNDQTLLSKAVVKLLIEKGADIESEDRNSQTPLSWAARYRHEAIVKLLIEKGADIESKDISGQTPLSWAAENGHEAVVKLLIEKGADIESKDRNGQTPLSRAIENRHEAVVKLFQHKL
ncbi:hypothetical protein QBC43DRAFT_296878 [Cladorrhinum sp. PSN259]|nr:hypothetical protein QBC43DRAFT_296878 [Cladorrhinum sp. PSN259]